MKLKGSLQVDSLTPTTLVYAATSGDGEAYTMILSPPITEYIEGLEVNFKANVDNLGAATLNINSLGEIDIKKNINVVLSAGDIRSGEVVQATYDGTNFQIYVESGPSIARHFLTMGG